MALDKDDIKQLIAILQKGLTEDEQPNEDQNNIKTKKVSVKPNNKENKFITMGFDRLHKEDIAIDKMLQTGHTTPRNRKFQHLDVRCRVCGKQESINPSLLYEAPDRYKCNKCCSSPG